MTPEFWQNKWQKNEIGFHLKSVHPQLKKYLSNMPGGSGIKVFVPLCGKTLDIGFLLENGYDVVANELSELAVEQLFSDLAVTPSIKTWQGGKCYYSERLTIWVGDYFALSQEDLGQVDWVYDRAALIALPEGIRREYASQMERITKQAP